MDYLAPLRSELKTQILLSLLDGEKKISELKTDVQTIETSILHILKEFEKLNLTQKNSGVYKLTSIGILEAQVCKQYYAFNESVNNFKDFWLLHDVSAIPPRFITKIGQLRDAQLVKSGGMELQKVHENFVKILSNSKSIKGISPIFHPDYISAFKEILGEGCSIDLIVTSDVLSKTMAASDVSSLQSYLEEGKIRVFLNDDIRFALTVTNNTLSLGLFSLSGEYDYSNDLVCTSQEGLEWGELLFESIRAKSTSLLGQQ